MVVYKKCVPLLATSSNSALTLLVDERVTLLLLLLLEGSIELGTLVGM
jgi:hypothetical protein